MQTPQLQLYNYVFQQLQFWGFAVIDIKDISQELAYPFYVVTKGSDDKALNTFDTYSGQIELIVDVWSIAEDAATHDDTVKYAENILTDRIQLDAFIADVNNVSKHTMIDSTTNRKLYHTQITATYNVY